MGKEKEKKEIVKLNLEILLLLEQTKPKIYRIFMIKRMKKRKRKEGRIFKKKKKRDLLPFQTLLKEWKEETLQFLEDQQIIILTTCFMLALILQPLLSLNQFSLTEVKNNKNSL